MIIFSVAYNEVLTAILVNTDKYLHQNKDVLMNTHLILCMLLCISLFSTISLAQTSAPEIQLATIYSTPKDIQQYWISEKLDGVRGYWDGKNLYTRKGNPLSPPKWFTRHWPKIAMDGELWIKRNSFEQVMSCVRRIISEYECWKQIKFMIFDLPLHTGTFSERVRQMEIVSQQTYSPYLNVINQFKLATISALYDQLSFIVHAQGEGLMLHHQDARYKIGRSSTLMKLKQYQDAEATVIQHMPGKGKYKNMLGALKVKTTEGIVFKVGSGFSDKIRANPPAIGSTITYKFIGKTQRGVPRFASFIRIRE